jgi:hypothetical protein
MPDFGRQFIIFSAHFFWQARASCAASAPGAYALKIIRLARTVGFVIEHLAIAPS